MYTLKFLNGQDIEVAKKLRPGQIVKLQYNPTDQQTDVFYENSYLGGIRGKIDASYAVIKNFEPLVTKTNFTFELLHISDEEAVTKEQVFQDRKEKRAKEIIEAKQQHQQIRIEKPVEKVYTENDIMIGSWFERIAKAYDFHRIAKKQSITSFFGDLFNAFAGVSEEEHYKEWLHNQIHNYLRLNPTDEELKRLDSWNRCSKLYPLMEKFRNVQDVQRQKKQKEISENWNTKKKYGPRHTYCWNCRKPIGTDTHYKCSKCKWIICSCGACSKGCS